MLLPAWWIKMNTYNLAYVCPSVISRYCIETAARITVLMLPPLILILLEQNWPISKNDGTLKLFPTMESCIHHVPKKGDTKLMVATLLILNRFSKFFTTRFSSKFAAKHRKVKRYYHSTQWSNLPIFVTYDRPLSCTDSWLHRRVFIEVSACDMPCQFSRQRGSGPVNHHHHHHHHHHLFRSGNVAHTHAYTHTHNIQHMIIKENKTYKTPVDKI